MKKPVAIGLLLVANLSAFAEIDLTPVVRDTVANGEKFQQLSFRDDKQRIDYEPPQGWKFDGAGNQVHLKPSPNFADALITVTPLSKPQAFDENTIKLLEQQFVASLPVGSQFAKIEGEVPNAVLLNGHESFEITVSYQSMGEKFLRSALFVNVKDAQLLFRLTARTADFAALHRDFNKSLFSWVWVEASEQLGATAPPAR